MERPPGGRRLQAGTRVMLERAAAAVLPGAAATADAYRDLHYDTAEGELARRGASAWVRHHADGSRTFTVEACGLSVNGPGAASVEATVRVAGGDDAQLFAGTSEPARLLRALADPARLQMAAESAATRTLLRGPEGVDVALDAISFRRGALSGESFEAEVQAEAGWEWRGEEVARALEAEGLRAVDLPRPAWLRARLAEMEASALEELIRASRRVAVVAFSGGRVALRREGDVLRIPAGKGGGEEACRRVLRACFDDSTARVRLLGTAPGSEQRAAVETWLAEGVDPEPDDPRGPGWIWIPLAELLAAVGSPALRDPVTLSALHVVSRTAIDADAGERLHPDAAPPLEPAVKPPALDGQDELPPGSLLNMELSVLAFNRRVLSLGDVPETPLLERVRFVSIFAANLDEFFRVRVSGFKRQVAEGSRKSTIDGVEPGAQLDAIGVRARRLMQSAYRLWREDLLPALGAHGVELVTPEEATKEERAALAAFFRERVRPVLTPVAAGPGHPFPHVRNLRPALAALIRDAATGLRQLVVVELPGDLPRFVPVGPDGLRLALLEEVIRTHLAELYPGAAVESAHCFRVTRSAELSLKRDRVADLLAAVEEEVRRRPFRPVVRVEVDREMPQEVRGLLLAELQFEDRARPSPLGEGDVYDVERPIDLSALKEVANLPLPELHWPPVRPAAPAEERPWFDVLREREVLVSFPDDSFEATVERFLLEAADDPAVASIKLALYRTNKASRIVEALRRASAAGKQVVALVELTARFDEERNIEWARRLSAAGIHVIYGLPGLKTHAKIALVTRHEQAGIGRYLYVGTGNLNASTAALYTDLGLLTADPGLGEEVAQLFDVITGGAPHPVYEHLLVAPHHMRDRFLGLIEREAEHARAGRGGHVRAKFNGLADRDLIAALYRASRAGVRIDLVVRGLCALRPGVPGLSENIRVYSTLGRFLEHSRIFRFENAGDPEFFIGSGDWRTRNLSRRVEVAAPVRDPAHRARLDEILERELTRPDRWELGSDGTYYRRPQVAPHSAGTAGLPHRAPILVRRS